MNIHFSKAAPSQIGKGYQLLKSAALRLQSEGVDQWQYWLDPPAYKKEWLKAGFDNGEYYFVCLEDQTIGLFRLSTSDLDYWGERHDKAYYLHSLVILPAFKGKSLGKKIVDYAEKLCYEDGAQYLRLDCHAGNPRLCQYYVDLGFSFVGQKQMPHSLNNLYQKNIDHGNYK